MSNDLDDLFADFLGSSRTDQKIHARERLMVTATEAILCEMERAGVSKAELARALNRSRGYISQVLSGDRNMTLGTLSDITFELDVEPHFYLTPKQPNQLAPSAGSDRVTPSEDEMGAMSVGTVGEWTQADAA